MVPMWLAGLGTGMNSALQAYQQKQKQQQQQQMIAALLKRNQQQYGGTGVMGPQSWGANNTSQGGTVSDQWGNPVGPAAGSAPNPTAGGAGGAGGATDPSALAATAPTPYVDPSMANGGGMGGFGGSLPFQQPSMSPQPAVPGLTGTSGTPQAAAFQAPGFGSDPSDLTMSALFSGGLY